MTLTNRLHIGILVVVSIHGYHEGFDRKGYKRRWASDWVRHSSREFAEERWMDVLFLDKDPHEVDDLRQVE